MKRAFWSGWSIPRKTAFGLILLGLLGLFAGNPYQGRTFTVDAKTMARIVQTEADHVAPETLADWIIQGKTDFRLLDVRTAAEYADYHIPGAEHVPLTMLLDHGLQKGDKIILYSEGGIHAAQGWFLLHAKGFRASYILRGGLDEWKERVLFPALPTEATPAQTVDFARAQAVSAFFGGTPRSGSAEESTSPAVVMPKPELPQGGAATQAPTARKKKKEGC